MIGLLQIITASHFNTAHVGPGIPLRRAGQPVNSCSHLQRSILTSPCGCVQCPCLLSRSAELGTSSWVLGRLSAVIGGKWLVVGENKIRRCWAMLGPPGSGPLGSVVASSLAGRNGLLGLSRPVDRGYNRGRCADGDVATVYVF